MRLFTTIITIVLVVINIPIEATELLPKDGYSKSECKGFHTHKLLEPYSVKIDTFKASTQWVDPQFKNNRNEQNTGIEAESQNEQDDQNIYERDEQRKKEGPQELQPPPSKEQITWEQKELLVVYEGTITFEDRVEEIRATREMTRSTQTPYASIGFTVPIYQKLSHNPFKFLKRYQEIELANTIEKIELVVNKRGVLYTRPAAFGKYGDQRVRVQPVSLCITFDLTKLEQRKTSSTKESFAFQQFDGFRVSKEGNTESASTSENEAADAR
ncbi:MAG: hypothetical protein F4W92_09080 [Gammaproteobacteria bacterium]|nr:hypothetical protein [Gammaproteobacteria bacterium]